MSRRHILTPLGLPLEEIKNLPRIQAPKRKNTIESGTTVLAIKTSTGIVLAADRKVSGGGYIYSQDFIKIAQINDLSAMLFAGTISDIQFITQITKNHAEQFFLEAEWPISIEGQANWLRHLMFELRYYGFCSEFILAGVNIRPPESLIYHIADDGCLLGEDPLLEYASTGSGSHTALTVLKQNWKKYKAEGMAMEQAIHLAVKAIYGAGTEDCFTSPIEVAAPKIALILPIPDKPKKGQPYGFIPMDDDSVKKVCADVLEEVKNE